MIRMQKLVSLLWETLYEIFDEAAYTRFLNLNRIASSREAYAQFLKENTLAKSRRPRCC